MQFCSCNGLGFLDNGVLAFGFTNTHTSGTDTLAIDSVLECFTELAELRAREKAAHAILSTDEQDEKAAKELAGLL